MIWQRAKKTFHELVQFTQRAINHNINACNKSGQKRRETVKTRKRRHAQLSETYQEAAVLGPWVHLNPGCMVDRPRRRL